MRRRIGQTQERRRIWWRPSKCRSFMWLCLYSHGPRKKIKRTHKYDFYFEFNSFQGTQWWPPGTPWTRRALRRCHWQSRRASNIEINMYLPIYPRDCSLTPLTNCYAAFKCSNNKEQHVILFFWPLGNSRLQFVLCGGAASNFKLNLLVSLRKSLQKSSNVLQRLQQQGNLKD